MFNHFDRIRREIETVKLSILDVKVIKSMDDYHHRTGYLMGLQKSLELFSEAQKDINGFIDD